MFLYQYLPKGAVWTLTDVFFFPAPPLSSMQHPLEDPGILWKSSISSVSKTCLLGGSQFIYIYIYYVLLKTTKKSTKNVTDIIRALFLPHLSQKNITRITQKKTNMTMENIWRCISYWTWGFSGQSCYWVLALTRAALPKSVILRARRVLSDVCWFWCFLNVAWCA